MLQLATDCATVEVLTDFEAVVVGMCVLVDDTRAILVVVVVGTVDRVGDALEVWGIAELLLTGPISGVAVEEDTRVVGRVVDITVVETKGDVGTFGVELSDVRE
jgi:hypothetical protein